MSILITSRSTKTPGPMVNIDCPACEAKAVPADSLQQIDRLELFYILPFFQLRNTFVTCRACKKQLISSIGINEMANLNVADLSDHLVNHVSFINQFVAILSLLLFWVPIVGVGLGLLAIALNWKITGWPKTISFVGAGLAALVLTILLALMAIWS